MADPAEHREEDEATVVGRGHLRLSHTIIKLKKVIITTSEDDEEVVLDMKSKLYRFNREGNRWKERRIGTAKRRGGDNDRGRRRPENAACRCHCRSSPPLFANDQRRRGRGKKERDIRQREEKEGNNNCCCNCYSLQGLHLIVYLSLRINIPWTGYMS
uniref:RanBD1 domain-containing protein n=1 Tax=Oryza nivara TaxID=4536 RepID=A0A0E0GKS6_ORYNI